MISMGQSANMFAATRWTRPALAAWAQTVWPTAWAVPDQDHTQYTGISPESGRATVAGDQRSLAMKSSTESPTLFRTLATVSTLGQRGFWAGLTRLLLLKEVGSRSAALARPEALRPCALAVRSIARQTLAWVNFVIAFLLAEWSDHQKVVLAK